MSAPAAKARSPAPVRTIAPARRVGVERARGHRPARRAGRSSERVERLGPIEGDEGHAGERPAAPPMPGAGAGNATATRRRGAGRGSRVGHSAPSLVVGTVSTRRRKPPSSSSGASSSTRSVRRVRARCRAGCARPRASRPRRGRHRGRPVVEVHRRDEDEVGLAAERLDDAPDARRAQPGRPRDQRQVLRRVAALELGERPRGRRRGGGTGRGAWSWSTSVVSGTARRRRATASVDR